MFQLRSKIGSSSAFSDFRLVGPNDLQSSSDLALFLCLLGFSVTLLLPSLPDAQSLWGISLASLLIARKFSRLKPGLAFLLAFVWACVVFTQHQSTILPAHWQGKNIEVTGMISSLPAANLQYTRFEFNLEQASLDSLPLQSLGTVLLSCYSCPFEAKPGQRRTLTIRLKQPHGYASWGAFDYEKYLFRKKIIGTGYVRTEEPSTLLAHQAETVNRLRHWLRDEIQRLLGDTTVSTGMILALSIGDKSTLTTSQKQVFQKTGVSHLLAISGLHVGLIFVVCVALFRVLLFSVAQLYDYLPRPFWVLLPSWLVAVGYSALAGFAVSTQRALIMLSVFVLCRLYSREVGLAKTLLISAVIILFYDPFSILDIGFWLSCGAVLIIASVSENQKTLSLFRLQPAIWLGMVPLSSLFFAKVSLLSPFVNLLMVPLFCLGLIPLLFVGMVLLAFGWETGASFLVQHIAIVFDVLYQALHRLSELPASQWFPPMLDGFDYFAFCVMLGAYLVRSSLIVNLRPILWCSLLICLFWSNQKLAHGQARATLLDVGQGLAMLIETRNSVTVYDTGPAYRSGFSAAKAVLIPYLRTRGISEISTLIISHADSDHIGGLPHLLADLQPKRILTSRVDRVAGGESCQRGQRWEIDGVRFEMLGPDSTTPQGSNNLSCVLKVSTESVSILISGDIEKPVERHLIGASVDLSADIMVVPHHGSKTSSTAKFIDAVEPQLALITAGFGNRYGHPHTSVVARYQERAILLSSTVSEGSILLNINPNSWQKTSYRSATKRFWRH